MATLKFYLQPANKKNLFPVMMCYQDRGKKFRFFTKVNSKKENWQKSKFKPISLFDFENKDKLDTCENVIREIEKEGIRKNRKYSISEVEQMFRENIRKTKAFSGLDTMSMDVLTKPIQTEFYNLFDQFVEQSKATKANGTIKHYKSFKETLLRFDAHTKQSTSFVSINSSFYERFHNYMINEEKMLNNTIGSQIKELKVFLNYAIRNELTEIKFNFKDFKAIKEDIDIIALSESELFKLYECKSLNKQQETAKDYFCFECFTGLRFSDIGRLKGENIKDEFIEIRTKKTKDILFVPINVFVKEILDKYKGKYENLPLPPPYSNQKINQYIKEAAKIAGINDLTMVEKFSGANRNIITKPKYAFISTHTGRRTFITLSHEKGMQIEMIMKITGIK